MAVYTVPQDVEAEDKLVGPFGFRQFIYLGIAAGLGFVGYVMMQISIFLIIIPLPVVLFFILLALPLRKEQPMETYLLALMRFYLKPKQRLWNPDGTISYVEIVVPKAIQQNLAKDYNAEAASARLDYLARVMDSRGWALKGATAPGASLVNDVIAEAQSAVDVFDEGASLSQSFASMIAKNDEQRRQTVIEQMHSPPATGVKVPQFNPYPASMHQRVIQPMDDSHAAVMATAAPAASQPAAQASPAAPVAQAQPTITPQAPPPAPVPKAVSPDIIRLASNDDLSISAIAHEAHRLGGEEEVVIKLR
jgi:hypothetical protein